MGHQFHKNCKAMVSCNGRALYGKCQCDCVQSKGISVAWLNWGVQILFQTNKPIEVKMSRRFNDHMIDFRVWNASSSGICLLSLVPLMVSWSRLWWYPCEDQQLTLGLFPLTCQSKQGKLYEMGDQQIFSWSDGLEYPSMQWETGSPTCSLLLKETNSV